MATQVMTPLEHMKALEAEVKKLRTRLSDLEVLKQPTYKNLGYERYHELLALARGVTS